MTKKAQKIIDEENTSLKLRGKHRIHQRMERLFQNTTIAIQIGYDDFAAAYAIVLVRAARIIRG